eukprot:30723-Pelagococcus_subviridis.AAC.13
MADPRAPTFYYTAVRFVALERSARRPDDQPRSVVTRDVAPARGTSARTRWRRRRGRLSSGTRTSSRWVLSRAASSSILARPRLDARSSRASLRV